MESGNRRAVRTGAGSKDPGAVATVGRTLWGMNHERMLKPLLVVAAVLVALAAAGVPVGAVLLPLAVLACPLMMVLMMRGMDHGQHRHDEEHRR